MPQAKTIKQAKAAYKTRSDNPLTEREQKQLERSVHLDRRAWALREREKVRHDATKKKLAQEKAQREEERRLGTQRRCDKFGFVSSQFHLGAFFRKPGPAPNRESMERVKKAVEEKELDSKVLPASGADDEFGEEGFLDNLDEDDEDEFGDLDDESLLEALQSPEAVRNPQDPLRAHQTARMPNVDIQLAQTSQALEDAVQPWEAAQNPDTSMPPTASPTWQDGTSARNTDHRSSTDMPPPSRPVVASPQPPPPSSVANQTESKKNLHDLFVSSVQEVRKVPDKSMPPPPRPCPSFKNPLPRPPPALNPTNFDIDLQDFLESSTQIARDLSQQGSTAPSPPVQAPAATRDARRTSSFSSGSFDLTEDDIEQLDPTPSVKKGGKAPNDRAKMPPPPPPAPLRKARQDPRLGQQGSSVFSDRPISGNGEEDFTMTQLESFVEDDLQLTQTG